MVAARIISHRRRVALLGLSACAVLALAGCGQRSALYMPDKNARVVTHAGSSAPASSSAPSAAPAAEPR
jgi:predicted small lipoprotein YifL